MAVCRPELAIKLQYLYIQYKFRLKMFKLKGNLSGRSSYEITENGNTYEAPTMAIESESECNAVCSTSLRSSFIKPASKLKTGSLREYPWTMDQSALK